MDHVFLDHGPGREAGQFGRFSSPRAYGSVPWIRRGDSQAGILSAVRTNLGGVPVTLTSRSGDGRGATVVVATGIISIATLDDLPFSSLLDGGSAHAGDPGAMDGSVIG